MSTPIECNCDYDYTCEACEERIAAEGAAYYAEWKQQTQGMPPSENGHVYGCVCDECHVEQWKFKHGQR
jgi:hypothetical protein